MILEGLRNFGAVWTPQPPPPTNGTPLTGSTDNETYHGSFGFFRQFCIRVWVPCRMTRGNDQRFVLQQTKTLKTSENHHIAETGYVCFCAARTSPLGWRGCGRRDRLRGQRTLAVSGPQWQWRQVSRWGPRDITAWSNIASSKVFCSLFHYAFFKDVIGSNLRLP